MNATFDNSRHTAVLRLNPALMGGFSMCAICYPKFGLAALKIEKERLKCQSPQKVSEALKYSLSQIQENLSELRVLDLGAGNGMMGEQPRKHGVARLVGVEFLKQKRQLNAIGQWFMMPIM